MLTEIIDLAQNRWDFFLELLIEHVQISLLSIAIAMVIGLAIGILISEYQKSSKVVIGIVNFIYTIPSISLLGFLIPLSGVGDTTAVIALSVYALLPMVRNVFMTVVLLRFIYYSNDYEIPLLYLPNQPVLARGVYELSISTELNAVPQRLAGCMVLLIPIMAIYLVSSKQLFGTISMGGLKE